MSSTDVGGGEMSHPARAYPTSGSESAVLLPGRVVAWRRWRLRPDQSSEPLLGSAHEDQIWMSRTLLAGCDPSRTWSYRLALDGEEAHEAPAAGCRCGIYAYRTPELARPMGPGVWMHGQVLIGGPMFLTDDGYRGRTATIDGPLSLTVECVGGDDLFSPTRCFEPPIKIKHGRQAYYPVCSSHGRAPVHIPIEGGNDIADFLEAAARLAASLNTHIAAPAST